MAVIVQEDSTDRVRYSDRRKRAAAAKRMRSGKKGGWGVSEQGGPRVYRRGVPGIRRGRNRNHGARRQPNPPRPPFPLAFPALESLA